MKGYDERISELEAEIDFEITWCEAKVLELRVKLDAVKGLKNASRKVSGDPHRWEIAKEEK